MKKNKVPHPNKLLAKHEYEIEQKAYFDKIKRAKSVLKTDNNNYDKRIQERKRKESRRSTDEEPCSSAAPSSREWHSSQPHQPPSNDFEPSSTLDPRQQEEEPELWRPEQEVPIVVTEGAEQSKVTENRKTRTVTLREAFQEKKRQIRLNETNSQQQQQECALKYTRSEVQLAAQRTEKIS